MRRFLAAFWLVTGWYLASATAAEPAAEFAATNDRPSVLLLTAQEPDMTVEKASSKLLVRELLRQAILIAGRDQLRMSTRDATLREPFSDPLGTSDLLLKVQTARSAGSYIRVTVIDGRDDKVLYNEDIASPLTEKNDVDYLGILLAVEERSRKQFVNMLQEAGARGEPPPANPAATVGADIDRHLDEMNAFSQFDAVRQLHLAQDKSGESRETLGALVRGYANLGQLTQFHWNASHKAYKARALIYAQRLFALDGESAWSHWHRAYAFALTGLHALALEDLALAESRRTGEAAGVAPSEPPNWVPLIDACCRYDTDRLRNLAQKATDEQQLAWFLACLTVESALQGNSFALQLAHDALDAAPDCLRIVDGMCNTGGVSILHEATVYGPQAFTVSLPKRLAEMEGLPDDLPRLLPDKADLQQRFGQDQGGKDITLLFESHPAVIARLLEIGTTTKDRGEPSWASLARLVEDITFVHLVRRGVFFMTALGIPVQDYSRHAAPLLKEHPYQVFFTTANLQPQRDRRKFWDPFAEVDLIDVEMTEMPLIRRTLGTPYRSRIQGDRAYNLAYGHADNTARELDVCLYFAPDNNKASFAHGLINASPHSPVAMAALLEYDPDSVAGSLADWDRENGQHPLVMGALFRLYEKLDQPDDARRALTRFLERSKDRWAFEKMADIHLAAGDVERWQKTLDTFLQEPDNALDHAQVQVKIANHFIQRKEWKRAQPYADAAAQSGASWALLCAARCYEGLGDADHAEKLVKYNAERYRGAQPNWYLWCRGSGHGDVVQAKEAAFAYYRSLGSRASADDLLKLGVIYMLDGQNEQAVQAYRQSLTRGFTPYGAAQLALLYDQLGDSEKRDQALKHAVEQGVKLRNSKNNFHRVAIGVAGLLQEMFSSGKFEIDQRKLEIILEPATPGEVANVHYFLGIVLERHGDAELGREFLELCANSGQYEQWAYTLARAQLRQADTDEQ